MGCPIRTSPDHVLFADPRSFSQLTASFFATGSLGILRSLFFSFSVSESLATFLSLHFSESQIILLVAYEIAVPFSSTHEKTRCVRLKKLINLLLVFLYLVIFLKLVNELPLFSKRAAKIGTFFGLANLFSFFFFFPSPNVPPPLFYIIFTR